MKKEQREIYRVLSSEVDTGLGSFCKYCHSYGDSSCDGGDPECEHPLEWRIPHYETCECCCPGADCWGFRPSMPVVDLADIVGVILSEGFLDWFVRYEGDEIRVYGTPARATT